MISKGRKHIRARILPNPISQYFKFELEVGYIPQQKVGFDFYFINEDKIKSPLIDFWLFDQKDLLIMKYNEKGEFLEIEICTDKKMIQDCIQVRNYFIKNGTSLQSIVGTIKQE